MPTTNITGPDRAGRFPHVGRQCKGGRSLLSRIPRWSGGMLLAIGIYFCSNPALDAQTSNSQAGDADKSWTATTESQSDNVNPTRTTESHTRSGNRTLDTQSVQRLGTD